MSVRKPTDAEIAKASEVFKALSHPLRLKVACLLRDEGDHTQKQLIEELDLPQSSVARYVDPLRQVGLVRGTRQGQEVLLTLEGDVLERMLTIMCDWFHEDENTETDRTAVNEAEQDEVASEPVHAATAGQ
jgi:DNA-binding transcriptional ArsR family regulator